MTEFARALDLPDPVEGVVHAQLSEDWSVGAAVNGGFLMALIGKALQRAGTPYAHPDPLTFTAHFLSASGGGPAEIAVDEIRHGRSQTTYTASLRQADVERVRVIAAYGDLTAYDGQVHVTVPMPDLPAPEDCLGPEDMPAGFKIGPFLDRLEIRMDPHTAGFWRGEPTGEGEIRAWVRTPDLHDPDPLLVLMALDCLPPVTFDFGRYGWAPTVELTAHLAARPAPGWLCARIRTEQYVGGLVTEDCDVWDSTGRLVGRSRQLAREPRSTATT